MFQKFSFSQNIDFAKEVLPWAGDEIGIGYFADKSFVVGVPIRDKEKAKVFAQRFTTSTGGFVEKKLSNGEDIGFVGEITKVDALNL